MQAFSTQFKTLYVPDSHTLRIHSEEEWTCNAGTTEDLNSGVQLMKFLTTKV